MQKRGIYIHSVLSIQPQCNTQWEYSLSLALYFEDASHCHSCKKRSPMLMNGRQNAGSVNAFYWKSALRSLHCICYWKQVFAVVCPFRNYSINIQENHRQLMLNIRSFTLNRENIILLKLKVRQMTISALSFTLKDHMTISLLFQHRAVPCMYISYMAVVSRRRQRAIYGH